MWEVILEHGTLGEGWSGWNTEGAGMKAARGQLEGSEYGGDWEEEQMQGWGRSEGAKDGCLDFSEDQHDSLPSGRTGQLSLGAY